MNAFATCADYSLSDLDAPMLLWDQAEERRKLPLTRMRKVKRRLALSPSSCAVAQIAACLSGKTESERR